MKNAKKSNSADSNSVQVRSHFQNPVRIILLLSVLVLLVGTGFAQLASNYRSSSSYSGCQSQIPKIQILKNDGTTNGWPGNSLFSSTDDGRNWKDIAADLPKNIKASAMSTTKNGLYIGTEDGKLYRIDGKGKWNNEDAGGSLPQRHLFGVYENSNATYVNVHEKGFFKRNSGSTQWKPMTGIPENMIPFTLYEFKKGTLFMTTNTGILKSTDEGNTWKTVFAEKWVNNLSGNGTILIGSAAHGLIRSTDGGNTWNYSYLDEGAIYETSYTGGMFTALRTFAPTGNYSDNSPWMPLNEAVRFRMSDDGFNWQTSYFGVPGLKTVYDFNTDGTHWYVSHKEGISCSSDKGVTWKLISTYSKTELPVRVQLGVVGNTIFLLTRWGGC